MSYFRLWCTILCQCCWKQFLGRGYTGWFAIAFPAVVKSGIWNLVMVPTIARLLFAKDTLGYLTSTNECWQIVRLINSHPRDSTHFDESPACETLGWQFITGSEFKPKLHNLEVSVRTSRPSCQPNSASDLPRTLNLFSATTGFGNPTKT